MGSTTCPSLPRRPTSCCSSRSPLSIRATSAMSARSASSTGSKRPLIARLWHGAVPATKGDDYAAYLRRTGVTECRATPGNRGVEVLRRTVGDETHFLFISFWDSMDAIRIFAGDDVERAHYYPEDRDYLLELEPTVTHYEVSGRWRDGTARSLVRRRQASRIRGGRGRPQPRLPFLRVFEAPRGVVREVDVGSGGELGENIFPNRVLGAAALAGLDQVANGQLHAVVHDVRVHDRGQLPVIDEILLGGVKQLLLGLRRQMLRVLDGDFPEDLLRLSPVALERHDHRHLVPDVAEALVVVGDWIGEDLAVRDMNDAPARLVRLHPRADLVERELEQAEIDHISRVGADLHPLPHLEGTTPNDEGPAGDVRDRLFELDRQPCRHQPQVGRQRAGSH